LYNPRIQKIEVLKLEKRLDENLMYLRDALPEYSTVDPEMKPVPFSPTGEVPVNLGIRFDLCMTPRQIEGAQKHAQPWLEYDMLKEYDTTKLEQQILKEVQQEMSK
ncbi:hypothetical protein XENOCAPTIV_022537, partial [Xenoophorus captivus]